MTDRAERPPSTTRMTLARNTVSDWTTDFDHYAPQWVGDPFPLWAEMRRHGPVASTSRYGGVCCPLALETVREVALDTESFSSRYIDIRENQVLPPDFAPPITSDPPGHRLVRMRLAPALAGREIGRFERPAQEFCRGRLARLDGRSVIDVVADYARPLPAEIVGLLLGISSEDVIAFQDWNHPERRDFIQRTLAERLAAPGEDLVSRLIAGQPPDAMRYEGGPGGTLFLLLIAGVDTTAAVISAGLLHLSRHPEDAARLRAERSLIPSAVEEFLRLFAPVSSARVATRRARLGDADVPEGGMVLLAFAAANRDPRHFPAPDRVVLDRREKGHVAFGYGIHRCLGANLARMLVTVAVEEWLSRVGDFRVADDDALEWTAGNVRGLKRLPIRLA